MTTDYSRRTETVRPETAAPESAAKIRALADEVVCQLLERVVARRAGPGSGDYNAGIAPAARAMAGPVANDNRTCAAMRSADHGVPIEAIDHAIDQGLRVAMEVVSATVVGTEEGQLEAVRQLVAELRDAIGTTSIACANRIHPVIAENRRIQHALTVALLYGRDTSMITRGSGVEVADCYTVLVIQRPIIHDGREALEGAHRDAGQVLRYIGAALDEYCSRETFSRWDIRGGIILIPSDEGEGLDKLLDRLSAAAGVDLLATCAVAVPSEIPDVVDQLRELLCLAQQLQCSPGLYRFADLAVQYQLTRPSPVRRHLGAMLDPLDAHPVLMETLRIHLGNNLNRRRSARQLNVHMNTIDYRLKKIGQLTGLDPSLPEGMWHLQAALVVRQADSESG